jgi:hypothetical protein
MGTCRWQRREACGLSDFFKNRRPQFLRIALAVVRQIVKPFDDLFHVGTVWQRLRLGNDLLKKALNFSKFVGAIRTKCHFNASRATRAASQNLSRASCRERKKLSMHTIAWLISRYCGCKFGAGVPSAYSAAAGALPLGETLAD